MSQLDQVEAGALFEYTWSYRSPMLLVATGRAWNEWQVVAVMEKNPDDVHFLSTAAVAPCGWLKRVRVSPKDLPLYIGWVKGSLFEKILKRGFPISCVVNI